MVADEVRSLAMRAAEAAKNTASLIEGTVKQVQDGMDLVERTNEAFSEVTRSSVRVGELVGEIAAASQEQAQGIEQVNRAVSEMDKVIQRNAANAEESASASEEMNAQAEQMKAFVGELAALIDGRARLKGDDDSGRSGIQRVEARVVRRGPAARAFPRLQGGQGKGAGEVAPDRVIPRGEKGMDDF